MDFSNYEKQGARAGQTVAYEVTELRNPDGTHPIVHLEHLGRTNPTFVQALIAKAGAETPEPIDDREFMMSHGVRKLERVYFSDGTAATDADIPAFVKAMPLRAFERMFQFAMQEQNFCEYPIATPPEVLAEK